MQDETKALGEALGIHDNGALEQALSRVVQKAIAETPAIFRPERAAKYCDMSVRQLYTVAERDPYFPPKIVFSPRCVGWRREALDAWLKRKESGEGVSA